MKFFTRFSPGLAVIIALFILTPEGYAQGPSANSKKTPRPEEDVVKSALNVGSRIPEFSLGDATGNIVKSSDLLAEGPLLITFYRGSWCPYCNSFLHTLQLNLDTIKSYGASLVAISGESPDNSLSEKARKELTFTVLSDTHFDVARTFGIVYKVSATTRESYLKYGLDLAKRYNTEEAELPLAATYIIDRDGTITYAFLDPDYRHRPKPEELLKELAKLKK